MGPSSIASAVIKHESCRGVRSLSQTHTASDTNPDFCFGRLIAIFVSVDSVLRVQARSNVYIYIHDEFLLF